MTKSEFIERLKDINRILDNSFEELKRMTTDNCIHTINTQLCIIWDNVIPKLKRLRKRHQNIEYVINNLEQMCNQMERISPGNLSHKVNNITQVLLFLNIKLKKIFKEI